MLALVCFLFFTTAPSVSKIRNCVDWLSRDILLVIFILIKDLECGLAMGGWFPRLRQRLVIVRIGYGYSSVSRISLYRLMWRNAYVVFICVKDLVCGLTMQGRLGVCIGHGRMSISSPPPISEIRYCADWLWKDYDDTIICQRLVYTDWYEGMFTSSSSESKIMLNRQWRDIYLVFIYIKD